MSTGGERRDWGHTHSASYSPKLLYSSTACFCRHLRADSGGCPTASLAYWRGPRCCSWRSRWLDRRLLGVRRGPGVPCEVPACGPVGAAPRWSGVRDPHARRFGRYAPFARTVGIAPFAQRGPASRAERSPGSRFRRKRSTPASRILYNHAPGEERFRQRLISRSVLPSAADARRSAASPRAGRIGPVTALVERAVQPAVASITVEAVAHRLARRRGVRRGAGERGERGFGAHAPRVRPGAQHLGRVDGPMPVSSSSAAGASTRTRVAARVRRRAP